MSAYRVHPDTIDYLVTAATRYRVTFQAPVQPELVDSDTLAAMPMGEWNNTHQISGITQPDLIGAVLHAQNVRSVNYRYESTESAEPYRYQSWPASEVDPVHVLKSCACLRYQSCETPDYQDTFAAQVLDRIEHAAINGLKGYDDAPWGWTRDEEMTRRAAIKARIASQLQPVR